MISRHPAPTPRIAGILVADAICFDVAYDDAIYEQVRDGAEMLVVQTSNATFIHTGQIEQQFAITRLRALETGRYVVVAAINGSRGFIAPDGSVLAQAAPAHPRLCWPRRPAGTRRSHPACSIGPWLGRAAVLIALGCRRWRCCRIVGAGAAPEAPAREKVARRATVQDQGRARDVDGLGRVVMVIPTYDEALNLAWIVGRLREAQPGVDVMVVDDNSPDGTGKIADGWPPPTPRSRSCTGPRRPAWARRTSTASGSRSTPATT